MEYIADGVCMTIRGPRLHRIPRGVKAMFYFFDCEADGGPT